MDFRRVAVFATLTCYNSVVALQARHWCFFRCLVQASYRELRHIGPQGDAQAKCKVSGKFSKSAEQCSRSRETLRSLDLWKRVAAAKTTEEVLAPYIAHTGLQPDDLPAVFRLSGWQRCYGGERWARIAETLVELRVAIDERNDVKAGRLCDEIRSLEHNSGALVPSEERWQADRWQREKWPQLCN